MAHKISPPRNEAHKTTTKQAAHKKNTHTHTQKKTHTMTMIITTPGSSSLLLRQSSDYSSSSSIPTPPTSSPSSSPPGSYNGDHRLSRKAIRQNRLSERRRAQQEQQQQQQQQQEEEEEAKQRASLILLEQQQLRQQREYGVVIPSDVAYVEHFMMNDNNNTNETVFDFDQIYLYSDQDRQFSTDSKSFRITNYHTLLYRGEIVWKMETTCAGNQTHGVVGESSTCRLSDTVLRVRVTTKTGMHHPSSTTTTAASANGVVVNAGIRDQRVIPLQEILQNSAQMYQRRASSFSSSSLTDEVMYAEPLP